MRKLLSLFLALCLLCGAYTLAAAEMDETVYKLMDSPFATFQLRRSFKLLGEDAGEDYYEGYFRANYSYSMYTDAYYLDRIELNIMLMLCDTPEAAAELLAQDMALMLAQEPEGSAYMPLEMEDGTVMQVLVRPGDGFGEPYDCRGVKGNLVYSIALFLSDSAGESEDRELLIADMVAPLVTSLQVKAEIQAE